MPPLPYVPHALKSRAGRSSYEAQTPSASVWMLTWPPNNARSTTRARAAARGLLAAA